MSGKEHPVRPFHEAHARIVRVIRDQVVYSVEAGVWLKKVRDLRLYEWPAITGGLFREADTHIKRALDQIREGQVELRAGWERMVQSGEAAARELDTVADMVEIEYLPAAEELGIPPGSRGELLKLIIDGLEGKNG